MKPMRAVVILTLCGAAATVTMPPAAAFPQSAGINWPVFRGPGSSGIAEGFATAVKWNAETGEQVLWKTPIPGLAHSSPIVWGDLVFVTTAISGRDNSVRVGLYGDINSVEDDSEHIWSVYALDKRSGEIVWERIAHRGTPKVKRHTKATHARVPVPAAAWAEARGPCHRVDGNSVCVSRYGSILEPWRAQPAALNSKENVVMEPYIAQIIEIGDLLGRSFEFFGQVMEQLGKIILTLQF